MAAITPITPRAVIRLWETPPLDAYAARGTLSGTAGSLYRLSAGQYGYGPGSPLGLDNFFDGTRASFTQLATLRRFDSFSMTQEENGISQWAAVYTYNATNPSSQTAEIVRAIQNKVMFASVYVDVTGDDLDSAGQPAVAPEPWFGGSLYQAAAGNAPASYSLPEWAYRGMVGPVNAVPLERNGPEGRLLLSGHCSLGWTRGVIHEHYETSGTGEPFDVWEDITAMLRQNCEVVVGDQTRPTDIGRYLIRAAFSQETTLYLHANPKPFVATPGTQSVLKDFQRYAEEADLLFNGLTPVIHFHRPRTADGGGARTIFRPHHYRKARNETERPRANRIIVFHNDSVSGALAEEWIDAASIAQWGVISESLVSVAPQATSATDDIGETAKREIMSEQAAAHARRSSESETGATDLSWTEGARWLLDWRLGDVVKIDDGFSESADLIVRRVSCQINGDGSFSFTPGFGAQSDVVATIGRNVQIQSTTAQERETIRLRKDVEDLKQNAYETDKHISNKQLEAVEQPDIVLGGSVNIVPWNITGDRQGIVWVSQIDNRLHNSSAYAFKEDALLEAAQRVAFRQRSRTLEADPTRNIELAPADFRQGLEFADGKLYSLDRHEASSATTNALWRLSRYVATTGDTEPAVRLLRVDDGRDNALRGAAIVDDTIYTSGFVQTKTAADYFGRLFGWMTLARDISSGDVAGTPPADDDTDAYDRTQVGDAPPNPALFHNRGQYGLVFADAHSRYQSPYCYAHNTDADGVLRMWIGGRVNWSRNFPPSDPIAPRLSGVLFCYSRAPGGDWEEDSDGDIVLSRGNARPQDPFPASQLAVSAWHNGLGSIYYVTQGGGVNVVNVPDERPPGLEWDEDTFEFGLPIGADGTTTAQVLGAVTATEVLPDSRGARPITYRIDVSSRSGIRIDSATGELTYVGRRVTAGDSNIQLEVSASVGGFGRRPAVSITTSVSVVIGGARVIRPQDFQIFTLRNTLIFSRPDANVAVNTLAAFQLHNVPEDTTPSIAITNIRAGRGGEEATRTAAAQGSVTLRALPVGGYVYGFTFRDDNPSAIGNELSFNVNVTAGGQSASAGFAMSLITTRDFNFYSLTYLYSLTGGFANADISTTERLALGGDYTYLWVSPDGSPIDEMSVSVERVVAGDTSLTDWMVEDHDINLPVTGVSGGLSRLLADAHAAGRIRLRYVGTTALSDGIHSVLIRNQGQNRGRLGVNNRGDPQFFMINITTSSPGVPRVILSDSRIVLKIGASISLDVRRAFYDPLGSVERFALPAVTTQGIVSVTEIVYTTAGFWQGWRLTGLAVGRTVISTTFTNAIGISESWRVFVEVVGNVPPVWNNLLWQRSVITAAASGTRVGEPVTATGEAVTYNLLAGRGSPQFAINENTGQITLARQAPAEPTSFTLIVRATSAGDVSAVADATVNISVVAPASVKAQVNPGWVGGTTIILKVGETANVDYTDAWISDQPSPTYGFLSADTSIATVANADAVATITAVAEGTTTITGTRTDGTQTADAIVVSVIVIPQAAVSRASVFSWYRLVGGVAQPITALAVRVPEGLPLTRVLAGSLFLAGSEIADRTITLTTPAGGNNIRVGLAADTSTITDSGGTSITAREVSLFLGAVGLDYEDTDERSQRWRVRADVVEYTDTDATPDVVWRAAQSDLGVNVTLADRNEPPTRNTSFNVADQTIEVGTSTTIDFTGAATDPDDDAIFYAATSSATANVTASFTGNILTLNGLIVGSATITWTFQTANSPVVMGGSFDVTVEAATRVNTTVQFPTATQSYSLASLAAGPTALTPNTTARAEATPPAVAGAITYSLSGRDAGLYTIDATSGQITLTGTSPAAGTTHNLVKTATAAQTATARAGSAAQGIIVDFRIARTPRFPTSTVAMNLPFGVNGTAPNPPVLVGRVQADEPSTYTLTTPVTNFSIDAVSGSIYFHGADTGIPSTYTSGQLGNGWTLPIAATNTAGTGNIQVLITVKSVVTINNLRASALSVNIPQGTAAPIELATIIGNRLITTLPQQGASASPPSFTFTGPNASRFSITDAQTATDKIINYVGDPLTLSATPADNQFTVGLRVDVAENGIALGATRDFTISCQVTPTTPVITGPAISFGFGTASIQDETAGGYEFPELYTATKAANETQTWTLHFTFPTDSQRQFSVDATTGRLTYDGPADIDTSSATSGYFLNIGVTNTAAGVTSAIAGLTLTINITSAYEPPTINADWSPGANWTKAADGSWSGTVARGAPQTINITSDTSTTGPYTIQSGLTASYRNTSLPTPPTAYSVARSDGSFTITASATQTGSGTLYLYMSDGTTEERLVFHIQVSATATASATSAVWYQDDNATYAPITDRGVTLNFPEGSSSSVSFNIYAHYTQIQNRTNATLAEPTLAGFDIVAQTLQRRTLTINSQSVIVDAWTIEIDPTMFDFETQSVYDLTAVLNVPEYTSGATTYAAAHKPLDIHLRVSDVNEPPARTAIATPNDFALRKQGAVVQFSLNGFWADPEGRSLSYRLTQSVVGATGGQSTNPGDYLSASIIGTDFQASAGQTSLETPAGVTILFSVEAYDGTQYSAPMTFSCTSIHGRALEDSPLAWSSGLPERLEWQVAENIPVPHILRSDIYATSTVTDQTATAGDITYTLEEAKWWPTRNTDYQWANNEPSLSNAGTLTVDMTTAFEIDGPDKTGKDFTISGDVTDSSVASIAINGKSFTITAATVTTTQTSTFIIYAHSGGFTANYVGTLTVNPIATITSNTGYTDSPVVLAAGGTTNVIVSNAFNILPAGAAWSLTATSSNTDIVTVAVNDATKTLTFTGASNLVRSMSSRITYTATIGSVSASRTFIASVQADPTSPLQRGTPPTYVTALSPGGSGTMDFSNAWLTYPSGTEFTLSATSSHPSAVSISVNDTTKVVTITAADDAVRNQLVTLIATATVGSLTDNYRWTLVVTR